MEEITKAKSGVVVAENSPEQKQRTERLSLLEKAEERLQQEKTEMGLATILGERTRVPGAPNDSVGETQKVSRDIPLAQLVQTNVTRCGTIIMIIFLVSILTPLYRYNIRLATFYDARGDILELLNTKLSSVGLVELASAFTPSVDFGRPPNTPIEQAIELLRQLRGGQGSDKKEEKD
jgi:hypothetical protein